MAYKDNFPTVYALIIIVLVLRIMVLQMIQMLNMILQSSKLT